MDTMDIFSTGWPQKQSKIRRNSLPYANTVSRPISARFADELRPIAEGHRQTALSTNSVNLCVSSGLRSAISGGSSTFLPVRTNNQLRSLSTITNGSTRASKPYQNQFSDSGFGSTLSAGSSCSFLPPPPPYRPRLGTSGSDSHEPTTSTSPPKTITFSPGAIVIGNGPIPIELFSDNPYDHNGGDHHDVWHSTSHGGSVHHDLANLRKDSGLYHHDGHQDVPYSHQSSYEPRDNSYERLQNLYHQQDQRQFTPQEHQGQPQYLSQDQQAQYQQQEQQSQQQYLHHELQGQAQKRQNQAKIHRSLSDSRYALVEPKAPKLSVGNVPSVQSLPRDSNHALESVGIQETRNLDKERGSSWTHSRISLSPSPSMSTVSCPEYPELQEKLRRLAITRDTLCLQVAVLTDQVGAQKEQIQDLETKLADKRRIYSYEVLSNNHEDSSYKADLHKEITELKARFTSMEREKSEAEKRLQHSQAEIERLTHSMQTIMNQHNLNMNRNENPDQNEEMEQLRVIVQRLMADNEQKKHEINTLRTQLGEQRSSSRSSNFENGSSSSQRFSSLSNAQNASPTPQNRPKNHQPVDINQQIRRLLFDDVKENMAHSSSFPASLCSSVHSANILNSSPNQFIHRSPIPPSASYLSSLSAGGQPHHQNVNWQPVNSGGTTPRPVHQTTSLFAQPTNSSSFVPASTAARQLAAELDEIRRIGGEMQYHNHNGQSSSLPRPLHSKSISALNLPRPRLSATSSTHIGADSDDELSRSRPKTSDTLKRGRTRSTLRNLFGKLTRSTSQEIRSHPFQRGLKSSASARVVSLGAPLAGAVPVRPLARIFCEWPTETVIEWLNEVGFGQYVEEAAKHVATGRYLLNMNMNEMEKELGIRSGLHRKKLRCLLNCIDRNYSNVAEPADNMDSHQVMLWLDDIGLPQLRDVFAENMIDGQMLVYLTVQDLVDMKVTSAMNHATLARGIQFLRSVDFNSHRIEKSFNLDILQKPQAPEEVEKWAYTCVVQWLKNIDLAEFTPNLMFSGVHGALIVHEPTFTAESLAEVLQIPAHKTLLRRHLTTHFNKLLGQDIISHKRDVLAQPHVTYLSPTLKIKVLKKGFSLTRKKAKNEVLVEPDVSVCPGTLPIQLHSTSSLSSYADPTSNV
ncbi:unnamed protein product [Bursaphelenchus okinawaensis]|uniref:SAM domain-containing protein n=1 Tax=Bursaphelenchus okinawaensis TaxID=465554 RepID=A0A811KL53_9BILA|nr:unnamed protein product [Bursaphelenchus okinawaensis]CAG9106873.1 unnamed protein product [Bursaphelenchus okinawaensis]